MRGDVVGGLLNQEAKDYLLCLHNEVRSEVALGASLGDGGTLPVATDMRRLRWDTQLEDVAQDYANRCIWAHNGDRTNQYNTLNPTDLNDQPASRNIYAGENLAAAYDSRRTSMELVIRGFNGLRNEGPDWTFGTIQGTGRCSGEQCGHFTQLVWAETYKVGCAVNTCPAGSIFGSAPSTYLVCNYAVGGNFVGRAPYKTGSTPDDVCSEATAGQSRCLNGLTHSD